MTAFCPMSHKASLGAKLRFPAVWHAKASEVEQYDSFGAEKSVKSVDGLLRTGGLYDLRAEDREALTSYWNTGDAKLVALIGSGGIGKSSLVQFWLREMRSLLGEKIPILVFTLQAKPGPGRGDDVQQPVTLEEFYKKVLRSFGKDPGDTEASHMGMKADKVLECLQENETLLIIDRLESYQHPGISQKGSPTEESLLNLIERLASSNQGMCVVTSRVGLWDSEKLEKCSDEGTYITREIDPLKEEVEVEFLKQELGIKEEPSKDVVPVVHNLCLGNPYVIKLLGSVLRRGHGGNVSRWQDVKSLAQDVKLLAKIGPQSEAATGLLASYKESLERSDEGKQQWAALRLLGFFNGPAPIAALAKLRREDIPGLNDELVRISDENWSKLLDFLQELRLVKLTEAKLNSHQLLWEYFKNSIKQSDPASEGRPSCWEQGCGILFDYYRGPQDGSAAGAETRIDDLYLAVEYGCEARRYLEAFITYWRDIQEGSPRLALYSRGLVKPDLGALKGFFQTNESIASSESGVSGVDWSQPVESVDSKISVKAGTILWTEVRAFLPLQAGLQLWHYGKYELAIRSLEAGKEMSLALERWADAAENVRRIAENLLELGRLREAHERIQEAIGYADLAGNETAQLQESFDEQLLITPSPSDPDRGYGINALKFFGSSDHLGSPSDPDRGYVINPRGYEQVDTRVMLGKILHQLGEWEKAEGASRTRRRGITTSGV